MSPYLQEYLGFNDFDLLNNQIIKLKELALTNKNYSLSVLADELIRNIEIFNLPKIESLLLEIRKILDE